MKQRFKKLSEFLIELVSASFIFLFIYAAMSKVINFEGFRVQLGKSPLVYPFVSYISVGVPAVELLIAVLFVFRQSRFLALCSSFTLMIIFAAYIVAILKFSSYVPCSCGGILENMTWTQHFYFNMLFVVGGGLAIYHYPEPHKELIGHKRESLNPLNEGAI